MTRIISYIQMTTAQEVEANHRFIEKCQNYGICGKYDWFIILNAFVRDKLIHFNIDEMDYEIVHPSLDCKEVFLSALKAEKP